MPDQSGRLAIGLVQTAPVFGRIDENLADLAQAHAELPEVDLAVSAELSVTGYGFDPHRPEWLMADGDERLAVLPPLLGVGYAQRTAALPLNAYRYLGTEAPVQHKLHPVSYAPWNEHLAFTAGEGLQVSDIQGVRVATLICNDMWHPVMPWYAVHAGAEVLVSPVASMGGGTAEQTWQTIVEHTARLLQCYVVMVNRSGYDGGAQFWGGSRVIGPQGETVVQLGPDPATVSAQLDIERLRTLRAEVPILRESRPSLVTELLQRLPPRPA